MTAAPLRLRSINSPSMSESCTGIDAVGKRSDRRLSRPDGMSVFCHDDVAQTLLSVLVRLGTTDNSPQPRRHRLKKIVRDFRAGELRRSRILGDDSEGDLRRL